MADFGEDIWCNIVNFGSSNYFRPKRSSPNEDLAPVMMQGATVLPSLINATHVMTYWPTGNLAIRTFPNHNK